MDLEGCRDALQGQDREAAACYCPVAATMNLLNGKWTLHILRELMGGRRRFNELCRCLEGVSARTLCSRLRALEDQGILVREIKHTIPPWVEYELTRKGQALSAVIASIAAWGEVYMQEELEACERALEACCMPEQNSLEARGEVRPPG